MKPACAAGILPVVTNRSVTRWLEWGRLPAITHPGERWVYGYNADILGALVEVVSGRPLDAFLAAELLEPLGMSDTHF